VQLAAVQDHGRCTNLGHAGSSIHYQDWPGFSRRFKAIHGTGKLAAKVAGLRTPTLSSVRLKEPKDHRIIGHSQLGSDTHAIVTGMPLFGIGVVLPAVLYGSIKKSPALAGKVKSANL